jgi:NADPH2:quinone reductase
LGLIACQWAKVLAAAIATAGTDAGSWCWPWWPTPSTTPPDFAVRVKEITVAVAEGQYDSVGKDTWGSRSTAAPAGLMASFGMSGPVAPFAPGSLGPGSLYVTRPTLFSHIATRETTQAMADDLFAAVTSGKVKIRIDQRYPLEQVEQAHRDLEARKTTGSTLLTL